jgi:16S rRNA (guanine(966)-N(2))-methyltransferase RsmD
MRVIAGKYKDLKIQTIDKTTTRPIMSKMKESIFSSLQSELYDAEVLDLFAGSGSLGLESLSRGAASCVFVEISKEAIEVINKNLSNVEEVAVVVNSDVLKWINLSEYKYDFIFIDPPYEFDSERVSIILNSSVKNLRDTGKIIVHRHSSSERTNIVKKLELDKEKSFGQSVLRIYKKVSI